MPALAIACLVASTLAVSASGSRAGVLTNTCRARNVTQGTAARSNLQRVIDAADPGDKIAVERVCVGNFRIERRLTIVGKPTTKVRHPALRGDGSGAVVVVHARVTLINLTITGGSANVGGGIQNEGTLVLKRSVVRGNTAIEAGGGIGNGGSLVLNRSVVRGNMIEAEEGVGGGIYNDETARLKDSVVRGNDGADTGAGIFTESGTTVVLIGSSVRGNAATDAGGGIANDGTLRLEDSVVRDNTASGSGGGGIYNDPTGLLTMNGSSSVRSNIADSASGGGIYTNGDVFMNDTSSVRGNEADAFGGGINSNDGAVTMNDASTVTGNRANTDDDSIGTGGGIWDCGTLSGALSDDNVDENFLGSAGAIENNIVVCP